MIEAYGRGSVLIEYSRSPSYLSNSGNGSGIVRYANGSLEVFDGMSWYSIRETVNIRLQDETELAIEWAKKKMQEEKELEKLMGEYPNVKDLKEKLDILIAIVREEKNNG